MSIKQLKRDIEVCQICKDHLPFGPRPIIQFSKRSKILIIGQAPGIRAHEAQIPWDDKSGDRLREWMGVSKEDFYDPNLFALVPMGFCYPGKGKTGDLPPRPECAPQWMESVRKELKNVSLELYVGKYAATHHFDKSEVLTNLIKEQVKYNKSGIFVLPHPSPRNNIWLKKNPWFEATVVKKLRREIARNL